MAAGASLVAQRLKRLPAMRETWVLIPGLGRSPGEGNGNPLQCSCLENPMDRGAWWATVHGVISSGQVMSPGAHKVLFVPSQSLFPQSCGSSIIKSHRP